MIRDGSGKRKGRRNRRFDLARYREWIDAKTRRFVFLFHDTMDEIEVRWANPEDPTKW